EILRRKCAICRRNFSYSYCVECEADYTSGIKYGCIINRSMCGHFYHTHCFSRWLKTEWQKCPVDDCKWKLK
ncbi:RING-box protein 1, partial [Harpegnathos saltator]